jgi:phage major head subunit gpT-like protein
MISGQVPYHLTVGARAGFLQALKDTPQQWRTIANEFPMSAKAIDLVDLGAAPMPVESGAGLTVQDFVEKRLQVRPKDWDITTFITHNAMRDDQTGTLDQRVRAAGQQFNNMLGNPKLFVKVTAGILYGYVGQYKDKVPLNHGGFSPAIIPSIGYRLTERDSVQVKVLGTAGLMFSYGRSF